jgi:RNA polymerase sigma-70 factor (ECF subfamily)
MTEALLSLEPDERVELPGAADVPSHEQRQAFAEFYASYQPRLLRYARRAWGVRDAEEITQETFARAFESIDLTRNDRSRWAWLVVVARNVAVDCARARRMCDVGPDDLDPEHASSMVEVEQAILDTECLVAFSVALSALPPSQSRAWWLSVSQGMTPTGIAESLACSPESVRQAMFKSRGRLAAAMASFCEREAAVRPDPRRFGRRRNKCA